MPFVARSKKKPLSLTGGSLASASGGCAACAGGGCASCPACMSGGNCGCLKCAIKDYAEAKGGGKCIPKGCVKIKAKRSKACSAKKPSLRGCVKIKRKYSTKPKRVVPAVPIVSAVPIVPAVPTPAIIAPMPSGSDSKLVPIAAPLPPPRAARRPARAGAPAAAPPRAPPPGPAFYPGPSLADLEGKHGPPPPPGPVIPYGGAVAIAAIAAPATIPAPPPGPVIDPCLNMVAKSLYDDSTNALDRARSELAAQTLAAERQVFEQARVQEELKRAQSRQEELIAIARTREGKLKDAANAEMDRIRTLSEEQLAREREQARLAFLNQQAQLQAAIAENKDLGSQLRALAEQRHADAVQHQTQAALLQKRGDELNAALLAQQATAEEKDAQLRLNQAKMAEAKQQDLINQQEFLKLTEQHRLEQEARAKAQREAEENARLRDEARAAAAMAAVQESKGVMPIPGTLPTPSAPPPPGPVLLSSSSSSSSDAPPPPGPVVFSSDASAAAPAGPAVGNGAYVKNERPNKNAFTQAGFEKDKKTALHISRIRAKAQIERNRALILERQRTRAVVDERPDDVPLPPFIPPSDAPPGPAFDTGKPVYGPRRPEPDEVVFGPEPPPVYGPRRPGPDEVVFGPEPPPVYGPRRPGPDEVVFGPEPPPPVFFGPPPPPPVYGPERPPVTVKLESVPAVAGAPAVAAANAELADAQRQVLEVKQAAAIDNWRNNVPDEGRDLLAARAAARRRALDPDVLIARFRAAYPEHAREPLSVQLAQALGLEAEGRLPQLQHRRAAAAAAEDEDDDPAEVPELPSVAAARQAQAEAMFAAPEHQALLAAAQRQTAQLARQAHLLALANGDTPPPLEPDTGAGFFPRPTHNWNNYRVVLGH